jgi:tetratricopeptide (TPR) repeat protein
VRAVAVIAALAWAASVYISFRRRPGFSTGHSWLLAWCLAGVAFSCYRSNTLNEWSLLAAAVAMAGGFSVLLSEMPEERKLLPPVMLVLGLVKAAVFWKWGGVLTANPALLGMFWALALVLGRPRKSGAPAYLWIALAAAACPLMGREKMSSAILGLAVGWPLAVGFARGTRRPFLVAGAAFFLLMGLLFAGPSAVRYKPDDSRRLNRLTMWKDSAVYALHEGAVGTGLGTFEQFEPRYKTLPGADAANFAHNEFLQIPCELGLPGLALVILLLIGLGRAMRSRGRESPEASAGLVMILLWANLYYPFRSDALLFSGALLTADLARVPGRPWSPSAAGRIAVAFSLAAVIALTQGVAELWELAGGTAWKAGRFEAALARFETAARWNPLEPRLLDHQVQCLRELGRKKETVPLLEKAVALKPRDVWLRRELSVARLNLVGADAAKAAYRPILDLAPNVAQFRREYEELK